MALLGHVLERSAGNDLNALFAERICTPLHMDSTRITLTTAMKSRLAVGHDGTGRQMPPYEFEVVAGAGALHSTANDMIKYASAQLGLTPSPLAPLIEKSHEIRHDDAHLEGPAFTMKSAVPWYDEGVYQPDGMRVLGHAGGTGGFSAFVGLDLTHRRGVVILSNQRD